MTRALVLYITASLDGYIADRDGGVAWLTGAEGEDYGFAAFMAGVDGIVMGSGTYLVSLALEGGTEQFEGRETLVFTARDDLPPAHGSPSWPSRPRPSSRASRNGQVARSGCWAAASWRRPSPPPA